MINDEQLNDRLIPDLFSRPGPATTVQQRPTPAASRATPDDPASDVLPETGGTGEQGCRREGAGKALVDPGRPLIQLWIVFSSQHRVHHAAWSASKVKSANSTQIKVCSDKGGCFSRGSRNRRTANPRGNTRAAVRQKQPRAQSRAPEPSFTARQIGTASNEAFVFRFDKFGKKEERLAPLNFLSALALHLHVTASALHCGQIVRSSRLTLNKSQ